MMLAVKCLAKLVTLKFNSDKRICPVCIIPWPNFAAYPAILFLNSLIQINQGPRGKFTFRFDGFKTTFFCINGNVAFELELTHVLSHCTVLQG